MKIAIVLCLVALAVVQAEVLTPEQITQRLQHCGKRAERIVGTLRKFKQTGVQQINKLKNLIESNSGCSALAGISAPTVPTRPPASEPEPLPTNELTPEEATAALNAIHETLTRLEHKIALMRHVGGTQIEIFRRFTEATGDDLCPGEGDD